MTVKTTMMTSQTRTGRANDHVLRKHSVESIKDYSPGTTIECARGVLWLTVSGDGHDYILMPGEKFSSKKRGRVLIEAVKDAVVHIETRN